jgi:proline racemase
MAEKRDYCRSRLDWVRRLLTYEPRGSSNSYGALITGPSRADADFGAVFFDSSGWHDMCGHASMGFACYAVRAGLVEPREPEVEVRLDTPAGLVRLRVEVSGGAPRRVRMVNVPSYVVRGVVVDVGGYGRVRAYLAYGGNLYAVVDLDELGLGWDLGRLPELLDLALGVWRGVVGEVGTGYPELYGVRLSKRVSRGRYYGVLLFGSPGRPLLDRSPSGTGSSAHLAYLHHLGEVGRGEEVEFVSAVGTVFTGRVLEEVEYGGRRAVVPEISTRDRGCYVTGYATAVREPDDPLGDGVPPLPL